MLHRLYLHYLLTFYSFSLNLSDICAYLYHSSCLNQAVQLITDLGSLAWLELTRQKLPEQHFSLLLLDQAQVEDLQRLIQALHKHQ